MVHSYEKERMVQVRDESIERVRLNLFNSI
jgi:hypothetical protein